jgi:GNAT superfamily N-acetyltransferase
VEWNRDSFTISTDTVRIDRALVHRFLTDSYWARGIPREIVDRSIDNALCFGIYEGESQVGFARVISDFATFAYLADVFVVESHRGRGLARWMASVIVSHPRLQGLRRWMLVTRDAHGLYRNVGFADPAHPERIMELVVADAYRNPRS